MAVNVKRNVLILVIFGVPLLIGLIWLDKSLSRENSFILALAVGAAALLLDAVSRKAKGR